MFDFIKEEIFEARMFRTPVSVSGRTAADLARVLYVSLLAVELVRQIDERTAQHYAALTIQWGDFDHIRGSATDLANIIAVLSNQRDFEKYVEPNYDISAPVLQIKSYLRSVWQGYWFHGRDRQAFMNIETMLGISDSTLSQIRRIVLDWKLYEVNDHKTAVHNIRRELSRHAVRLDLIEFLPNL
jgi:hypothetical protein